MTDDHQNLLPQYGCGEHQTRYLWLRLILFLLLLSIQFCALYHLLYRQLGKFCRTSCNWGTKVFSILAVLLLAGQAVTVYFVYQHEKQISKLTKSTQKLTLDSLSSSISKNTKPRPNLKMAMADVMPMIAGDPEFLAAESKLTNSTEDQVKRLLLLENPTRTFPVLQSNFLENMGQLKISMAYGDWKEFETWMHKWLIFQIAQKQNSVKTKCQQEECGKGIHPGKFCAQCDEKGDYLPMQCLYNSGFCWCVYKDGTQINGTEIRGQPNCSGIFDLENITYSGEDQI